MDYICSFSEVQCTFLLNMTMFMYYFAVILLADHLPFPMPSTDKSGSFWLPLPQQYLHQQAPLSNP